MSGPKAVELKFIISAVEFCRGEINEIMPRLKELAARMDSGGFKTLEIAAGCLEGFDDALSRAERAFAGAAVLERVTIGERRAAAETLLGEIKKSAIELFGARREIARRITLLRDSLMRRLTALESARLAIAGSHLRTGLSMSAEDAEKARREFEAIAGPPLRPCPDIDYENFDNAAAMEYAKYLDSAEADIALRQSRAEELARSVAASSLAGLLPEGQIISGRGAADLIAQKKAAMAPSKEESALIERAAAALAMLSDYPASARGKEASRRFDAMKSVESPQKRLLLYEDLILFCGSLLAEERRAEAALEEAAALRRKLALAGGDAGLEFVASLERLEAARDIAGLEALLKKGAEFLRTETAASEAKRMGEIFRAAFEEMGYETGGELSTAMASGGIFFMDKPALKNYRVRVISSAAAEILQIELVRTGGVDAEKYEPEKAFSTRDVEAQTEFCADYEGALKKMEARGVQAKHKMRKKPGETVVRTIPPPGPGRKAPRAAPRAGEKSLPPSK